jgi:hypothetical protein
MSNIVTAQSLKDDVLNMLGKAMQEAIDEAILDEWNVSVEEGLPPYMVEVNFDE